MLAAAPGDWYIPVFAGIGMKKMFAVLLVLMLPATGHGQHGHSHGAGRLDLVVEKDRLTLDLEIPQHDLVGFERAPKGAAEKRAVQFAMETLKAPEKLFAPSVAAGCAVVSHHIDAPLLDDGKSRDGHGDVEARYVYRCARPEALIDLKVNVMDLFSRVRTLSVRFSGPKGQKAGRLDRRNAVFSWQ